VIVYLPGEQPEPDPSAEVEFLGGPRNGERRQFADRVVTIPAEGGTYQRSVSCSDDGVLRYVWVRAT
jgi:hypothetical protein